MPTDHLRIVFCWSEVVGYMAACWRALAAQPGVSLHILHPQQLYASIDNPFNVDAIMHGLSHEMFRGDRPDVGEWLVERVTAQQPDVVVHCGWIFKPYASLVHAPALASVPMMLGMDSPWLGTATQRLNRYRLRALVERMRLVVVAGDRSAEYARRIGVDPRMIRSGYYGFDDAPLAPVASSRTGEWPRRFLFIGRYVDQKDLPTLVRAYALYRSRVSDPWPLSCCGTGPGRTHFEGVDGITDLGFRQPAELPSVLRDHGAFVMASKFEPWGVVIAEAASSGLPVICTTACGAGLDIVRPYYNGLTVTPEDPESLCRALLWTHHHSDRLRVMGQRGRELSAAYSATAWGERWLNYLHEVRQA